MDIEQRFEKLEREVEFLLNLAEAERIREEGVEWDFSYESHQDNTVESERLKVRHQMAKSVAEIIVHGKTDLPAAPLGLDRFM